MNIPGFGYGAGWELDFGEAEAGKAEGAISGRRAGQTVLSPLVPAADLQAAGAALAPSPERLGGSAAPQQAGGEPGSSMLCRGRLWTAAPLAVMAGGGVRGLASAGGGDGKTVGA